MCLKSPFFLLFLTLSIPAIGQSYNHTEILDSIQKLKQLAYETDRTYNERISSCKKYYKLACLTKIDSLVLDANFCLIYNYSLNKNNSSNKYYW